MLAVEELFQRAASVFEAQDSSETMARLSLLLALALVLSPLAFVPGTRVQLRAEGKSGVGGASGSSASFTLSTFDENATRTRCRRCFVMFFHGFPWSFSFFFAFPPSSPRKVVETGCF